MFLCVFMVVMSRFKSHGMFFCLATELKRCEISKLWARLNVEMQSVQEDGLLLLTWTLSVFTMKAFSKVFQLHTNLLHLGRAVLKTCVLLLLLN